MSLSEVAVKKICKNEIIALGLDYQYKFDESLDKANEELQIFGKRSKRWSQNCLFRG